MPRPALRRRERRGKMPTTVTSSAPREPTGPDVRETRVGVATVDGQGCVAGLDAIAAEAMGLGTEVAASARGRRLAELLTAGATWLPLVRRVAQLAIRLVPSPWDVRSALPIEFVDGAADGAAVPALQRPEVVAENRPELLELPVRKLRDVVDESAFEVFAVFSRCSEAAVIIAKH